MKKFTHLFTTIASVLAVTAGLFISPIASANAEGTDVPPVVTADNAFLTLPDSYDQYLSLNTPTSVAHSENYFAISDGTTIYIYDVAARKYKKYEHTFNTDDRFNSIAQLGFAADGALYFTDKSMSLYRLDCGTLAFARTPISCSTFTISGELFYYSTITNNSVTIAHCSTTNLTPENSVTYRNYSGNTFPALSLENGELIYVDRFYLNNGTNVVALPFTEGNVISMASQNNVMFFCTDDGVLHVYDYSHASIIEEYRGTYCYVERHDGFVYAVNGNKIEQFNAETGEKTLYSVCDSSDAVNRLSYATDTAVSGNTLYIADRDNRRISVYNEETAAYYTFDTDAIPTEISADATTVLVNYGSSCSVYDVKGNELYSYRSPSSGEVFYSSVNVYGTYYLITSNNSFYKIALDENGEYTTERVAKSLNSVGKQIASDLYGNLYVYFTDLTVSKFTETEFMDLTSRGSYYYTFPSEISCLLSDYKGNVYGLSGNTLLSNRGTAATVQTDDVVYGAAKAPLGVSFDFSSSRIFLRYPNYLLRTTAVELPDLKNIPTENASEEIFGKDSKPANVVTIEKNSVLINFELSELYEATTFPYKGCTRLREATQAIVLGETEEYYVVSIFDQAKKRYASHIVPKQYCAKVTDTSLYLREVKGFTNDTGYTTNAVEIFKYPFLSESMALVTLEKSYSVHIDGEMTLNEGLDYSYYLVSAVVEDTTVYGYMPAVFLSPVSDTRLSTSTISKGHLTTDKETIEMTAENLSTITVSTEEEFIVYGDPYEEAEVLLSFTKDGVTYYATVSSDLLKTTNTRQLRLLVIGVFIVIMVLFLVDYFLLRPKRSIDDYE